MSWKLGLASTVSVAECDEELPHCPIQRRLSLCGLAAVGSFAAHRAHLGHEVASKESCVELKIWLSAHSCATISFGFSWRCNVGLPHCPIERRLSLCGLAAGVSFAAHRAHLGHEVAR